MENIADVLNTEESRKAASIKIIGVGGGGGNAANHMYEEGLKDVEFIICNSDQQDLKKSPIPTKVFMGDGHGCGSNTEKGEQYAKEKTAEIEALVQGTEMVFITAGMGGGTGTGAAPVIAKICKDLGILTVGIVTVPFQWEGPIKYRSALKGIEALSGNVDSLLVINNETIIEKYGDLKFSEEFRLADETLSTATHAISDILQKTGYRNVDFEDVRAVMKDSGIAVMASGVGSGEERAYNAIENTLDSPLLNKADIRGAKKILLNISSSEEGELSGNEISIIMNYVRQTAQTTDVDITWGYMLGDPDLKDEVQITMIATGFDMDDIPDFKKPEEPNVVTYERDKGVEKEPQKPQMELFPPQSTGGILINNGSYKPGITRRASDASEYEDVPAALRNGVLGSEFSKQKTVAPKSTAFQTAAQMVEERIKNVAATEPSRFSISKDDKGVVLGGNKYLGENVD